MGALATTVWVSFSPGWRIASAACDSPPRRSLKNFVWLGPGLPSETVQATIRPSRGIV